MKILQRLLARKSLLPISHRKPVRRPIRGCLGLERLEDRVTPSQITYVWTNGDNNGLWSDANNWTNGGPASLPAFETAVLEFDSGTAAATPAMTDDIANLTVDEIHFAAVGGSAGAGYIVNGSQAINLGVGGVVVDGNFGDAPTINVGFALAGNSILEVDSNSFLFLNGVISDPTNSGAGLTKTGTGGVDLSAVNQYFGNTSVFAGELALFGPPASSLQPVIPGVVTVDAGATLAGDGGVGSVRSFGGTVDPDPFGAGLFTLNNSRLDSQSTFEADITGSSNGSLNAGAPITLGNAFLSTFLSGLYNANTTFTILTGQYSGAFGNAPSSGSVFTNASGQQMRIQYLSNSITLTLLSATTTTSVAVVPTSSVFEQPVTLTATVQFVSGTISPTGTVTFFGPNGLLQSNVPFSSYDPITDRGTASIVVATLPVGSDFISANYSGDPSNGPSSGFGGPEVVAKASTSTTLTSPTTTNTTFFGQPITVSAAVAVLPLSNGLPIIPSGTVDFKATNTVTLGVTDLGAAPLVGASASETYSALAPGTYTITATYVGDNNFLTSTSAPSPVQTVLPASTSTTVQAPPTAVFEQPVTLSATVVFVPGTTSPTGTVQFFDNGQAIGNPQNVATPVYNPATHSASVSITVPTLISAAAPGQNNAITAVYTGDPIDLGSSSTLTPQIVVVSPAQTTEAFTTPPPAAAVFEQPETVTVQVSVSPPSTGLPIVPTGTVDFIATPTVGPAINLGNVLLNGNQATASLATLPPGSYIISAAYVSATPNDFANPLLPITAPEVVSKAATALAFTVPPPATAAFQQPVTVTAQVSVLSPSPGLPIVPTGAITFMAINTATMTPIPLGPSQPLNAALSASANLSNLPLGSYIIEAVYSGDGNFLAPAVPTEAFEVVGKAPTTTTLTAPAAAASFFFGQSIPLSASVSVNPPASGVPVGPTGSVNFIVAPTTGGAPTTSIASLIGATASTNSFADLAVGKYTVTASYQGDPSFAASTSAPASPVQTINAATTTVGLFAPAAPLYVGSPITFSGTLTNTVTSPAPLGSVDIFDGTTDLGPASIGVSGGNKTTFNFTTSALTLGSHTLHAVYTSNGDFTNGPSNPVTVVLTPDLTSTAVGSSLNPSTFTQIVTFTAAVLNAVGNGVTPTGTVTFFDGSTPLGPGSPLSSSGTFATSTFTTSSLAAGDHTIRAVYTPTAAFQGSQGSIVQHVGPAQPPGLASLPPFNARGTLVTSSGGAGGGGGGIHALFEPGTPTASAQTVLIASTSAVADASGTTTFAIANDNTLWRYTTQYGWVEISNGSFRQLSAVTRGAGANSQAAVFAVLTDFSLWEFNGSLNPGGWAMLSPAGTINYISGVTDAKGDDLVYAITADTNLWEHSPTGWAMLSSGSFSSISAGLTRKGDPVVYGVLTDESLWEYNAAGGGGWQMLSGAGTILSATAGSQGDVFAITADRTLWEHNGMDQWQELSTGSFASIDGVAESTSGPLDLFATVTDGSHWEYSSLTGWSEISAS